MTRDDCTCGPWPGLGPDCPEHKTGKFAEAKRAPKLKPKRVEVVLRLTMAEACLVRAEMQFGVDVGADRREYRSALIKVKRAIKGAA